MPEFPCTLARLRELHAYQEFITASIGSICRPLHIPQADPANPEPGYETHAVEMGRLAFLSRWQHLHHVRHMKEFYGKDVA